MNTLPTMDLHCHTAHPGALPVIEDAVLFAQAVDSAEWDQHASAASDREIWGVGLHPLWLQDVSELDGFLERLPKSDAVGEIGMDFTGLAPLAPEQQHDVLNQILRQRETQERIISLHAFLAYGEVLDLLVEHSVPGAIVHWYADPATVERAVAADVFYSVNEAIFASPDQAEAVGKLSRDRVLVETDTPYIGHGGKILHGPALPIVMTEDDSFPEDHEILRAGGTHATERLLAKVWGVSQDEVRLQLWQNLAALEERVPRAPFGAADILRRVGG